MQEEPEMPSVDDIRNWKKAQIEYFRGYLNNFQKDSREYNLLIDGIRELEKNI
jgi:hypothetical protein